MPNRLLTKDELPAAFREQARVWQRAWQEANTCRPHCWHDLQQTQMCCWCGQPRALQHGPYMPEGDR